MDPDLLVATPPSCSTNLVRNLVVLVFPFVPLTNKIIRSFDNSSIALLRSAIKTRPDIVSPDVSIPDVFQDEEQQETAGDVSIQSEEPLSDNELAVLELGTDAANPAPAKKSTPSQVTMQAENFGGGLAVPNYGHRRPPAENYNSNLIFHNYVTADISTGK